jgi:lipopolysaccharide export LptBFGC system permease protein LptF
VLWTLWRAILFEFWRLLILTTAVVVAAIAFAATIKPIADGSLSIDQALRFMGYAIPPMLAYALPFAACFASTMTYFRLVQDNESIAAHASGISHKQLLLPMLLSGIVLGASLMALNNLVIPRFLQRMEEMVTRDFAKILVNSLSQGQTAMIGDTEIHADVVREVTPEPDSPAQQQFLLGGVVMVEANDTGAIRIDGTAHRAWILLLPAWALPQEDRDRIGDDDATAVVMKFNDLTVNERGDLINWESVTSPAIPIPRVFKDDPKFMTSSEMLELHDDPDRMNFVDRKRLDLARRIAAREAFDTLRATLDATNAITLRTSEGRDVTILAGSIERSGQDWSLTPVRGSDTIEVVIDRSTPESPDRVDRLRARAATLSTKSTNSVDPFDVRTSANKLAMTLDLSEITILGSTNTESTRTQYTGLTLPSDPLTPLLGKPSAEMLDQAAIYRDEDAPRYDSGINNFANNLEYEIAHLSREVLSKIHERWAFAAASLMMVLTGAVTAMRLKHAQPLNIYLWSFFPALLTILLIAGGQQATHKHGEPGLPLLWAGVLLITLYTLNALRKVQRF